MSAIGPAIEGSAKLSAHPKSNNSTVRGAISSTEPSLSGVRSLDGPAVTAHKSVVTSPEPSSRGIKSLQGPADAALKVVVLSTEPSLTLKSLEEEERECYERLVVLRSQLAAFPHSRSAREVTVEISDVLRASDAARAASVNGAQGPAEVAHKGALPVSPSRNRDPGGVFTPEGYWDLPWEWVPNANSE
jgi:hypothetical protein